MVIRNISPEGPPSTMPPWPVFAPPGASLIAAVPVRICFAPGPLLSQRIRAGSSTPERAGAGCQRGRRRERFDFRVDREIIQFDDLVHGPIEEELSSTTGDFVIKRAD